MVGVSEVVAALRSYPLVANSGEVALQVSIAEALEAAGIMYDREHQMPAGRIDFAVGSIGIEVKVDGATPALLAQLQRYASNLKELIVVTTVLHHRGLPSRIAWPEANIHVVYVSKLASHGTVVSEDMVVNHPDGTVTFGIVEVRDGQITIEAAPHVMARLRRLFPRAGTNQGRVIAFSATPEAATDVEWLMSRWPLRHDGITGATIDSLAAEHAETIEAVAKILAGAPPPEDHAIPARPARWPHQTKNAAMIATSKRLLITDPLGAGKSYSGAMTLANRDALPAVVMCPVHLQEQWRRELAVTWPNLSTHIVRKATPYDPTTIRGVDRNPDVLIVPYSKAAGWAGELAGNVKSVLFDEVQELRNGKSTNRGIACSAVANEATYVVGLSATPIHNYGGDIFNVMEMIRPGMLGTRAEFLREHCGESGGDKPRLTNPASLAAYLTGEGAMIGSKIEAVAPLLVEHTVSSDRKKFDELVGNAAELARFILSDDTPASGRWRAAGEFDMRMRQATGIAKAPYVATFVDLLLESVDKLVLFGWHRAVYSVWLEHLSRHNPVLYTGTESPTQKMAAAKRFTEGDSRVMIMSLRSGAGLDGLQAVSNTVVFGELDWSPAVHTQAVGRLNRPGQENTPVVAYFVTSDDGADPTMVNVLGVKERQAAPFVISPDQVFTAADAEDRIKMMARDLIDRGR